MKNPVFCFCASLGFVFALIVSGSGLAADPVKVTAFNFVRAESDHQMKGYAERAGGVGKLKHLRDFYPVDPLKQTTIRGNRDTLYSMGVFDLTSPVTIIKPDAPERFQSMMVVNQDHSAMETRHEGGAFTLTQENVGTRYAWVLFRTFAHPDDPADIKAAHALQDEIVVKQASRGRLELPNWDAQSRLKVRGLLNELGLLSITDFKGFFGDKESLDPVKHLLGAAYGWGGNPEEAAMYAQVNPDRNDGETPYVLTVKDVPVNGFWSVTVYNADGFLEENEFGAYSFNNKTATPNEDGGFTIHFGGNPDAVNFLPISKGWNYTVRMYEPREEIRDGVWTFPPAVAAE